MHTTQNDPSLCARCPQLSNWIPHNKMVALQQWNFHHFSINDNRISIQPDGKKWPPPTVSELICTIAIKNGALRLQHPRMSSLEAIPMPSQPSSLPLNGASHMLRRVSTLETIAQKSISQITSPPYKVTGRYVPILKHSPSAKNTPIHSPPSALTRKQAMI